MSRIEAVVCDWGGVLTTPLFGAFARVQEHQGVPLEAFGMAMWRATQERGENPLFGLERGDMTESEFLGIVGAALREEVGRDVSMEGFAERWFGFLSPNEDMIAFLRELRDERGLRLAMLTNNVREWEERWRSMLPVDELFEIVVDSPSVGLRKPDPRIYELTLERLGLPGEACAFVDDLEENCEAARALGMTAIRFVDAGQARRDLEAALGA